MTSPHGAVPGEGEGAIIAPAFLADVQQRDPTGTVACRVRIYDPEATAGSVAPRSP
jgi:hypothetical protein